MDITPSPGNSGRRRRAPGDGTIDITWIPLTARVAIFDDGDSRCVILALDLASITRYTADRLRSIIASRAELDPSGVFINCSHTHNGVLTTSIFGEEPDLAFLKTLEVDVLSACEVALANLGPVELHAGATETSGLTFNRRPVYEGEEVGTHGPLWVPEFLRLEGPADGELQMIIARSPDGSVAGGMANFACHPHMMISEPVFSADFVGMFVNALGARHGGVFLFLQGASGDLSWQDMSNPLPPRGDTSRIAPWGLPEVSDWAPSERIPRWTAALLAASDEAIAASFPVVGHIRTAVQEVELAQRRPTEVEEELALWYLAQPPGSVDDDAYNKKATGHAYTMYANSEYQAQYAREILDLLGWQRLTLPAPLVERPEVIAIALGDVALVGYPAEMFTDFGLATKVSSPFKLTAVCGLTNGWYSYVPTADAYTRGGFETRLASSSRLEIEAGDKMVRVAIDLLSRIAVPDAS